MLTAWWRRQTSSTTTPSLVVFQGQEHQLCGQCRDICYLLILQFCKSGQEMEDSMGSSALSQVWWD